MVLNLIDSYMSIPLVTRVYTTLCFLTTLAVDLNLVSPFQLYFSWTLIFRNYQIWRIITSFCYFGTFGFGFMFNMIFTYRHCSMLEESSFSGRRADFVYMFLIDALLMVICASFVTNLVFLGQSFTIMLVYVWSRRNPNIRMNFFGVLAFNAPYLPWVLFIISLLLGNNAVLDGLGIACGHIYYFFEDVLPYQPHGWRVLQTPRIIKYLFDEDPHVEPQYVLENMEQYAVAQGLVRDNRRAYDEGRAGGNVPDNISTDDSDSDDRFASDTGSAAPVHHSHGGGDADLGHFET